MRKQQQGFTLIEIAIVLVIIGLLLGGVLKGQELIQNARVRNIISQQDGIKAAYFGFQDRYRGVPGDYPATNAISNIPGVGPGGVCAIAVCGTAPNASNGLIDTNQESITAWFHLSRSGFITGSYDGAGALPTLTNTPTNPYGGFMQLINDAIYDPAGGVARNNVKTGAGIPATILGEVDRKIDDGNPSTGEFRFSPFGGALAACMVAPAWDVNTGQANCGAASLF